MTGNMYICTECYNIMGDSGKACKCEVEQGSSAPSVCLKSPTGLVKWKCQHNNMELHTFKNAEKSTSDETDVWWLTGVHKCTACDYTKQGFTSKYRITKV